MALDVNALRQRVGNAAKSFTPSQLVVIGLLMVVAAVGGLAFLKWSSTPSYSVLFSGLDAKDASAVTTKLKTDGVDYKLGNDGTAVLVPSAKVYESRLALSAAGLPKGSVVGYELLDKQSVTTSDFREQVDYQRAVEGELARTLMAVKGVQGATVHLAIPKETLFSDNQKPTRASVLLKTSEELSDDSVQSIVHLVASSVPGLAPDDVTVADAEGHVLSTSGANTGTTTREMRLTHDFEGQLASSASSMLSQVIGPNHAVVRVSAQLNYDQRERETETYDPQKQALLREQNANETYKGQGAPPGGVLGVDGGQVGGQAGANSDYQKQNAGKEYGVDRQVERSKLAPGKVERLSVAVVLDGSARPLPPVPSVEKLVGAALGLNPARGDTIAVDTVKFDTSMSQAAKDAQAKQAGKESTERILSYVRTGVGLLVLVLVLFLLRRGMRGSKVVEQLDLPATGPGSLAAAIANANAPAGALSAGAGAMESLGAGDAAAEGSLRDSGAETIAEASLPAAASVVPVDRDLLQLIDQQPDEVAVLLRGWLADRRS